MTRLVRPETKKLSVARNESHKMTEIQKTSFLKLKDIRRLKSYRILVSEIWEQMEAEAALCKTSTSLVSFHKYDYDIGMELFRLNTDMNNYSIALSSKLSSVKDSKVMNIKHVWKHSKLVWLLGVNECLSISSYLLNSSLDKAQSFCSSPLHFKLNNFIRFHLFCRSWNIHKKVCKNINVYR